MAAIISLSLAARNLWNIAFYLAAIVFAITTLSSLMLPNLSFEQTTPQLLEPLKQVFSQYGTYVLIFLGISIGVGQIMFSFSSVILDSFGFTKQEISTLTSFYYIGNVLGAILASILVKTLHLTSKKALSLILLALIVVSLSVFILSSTLTFILFFLILGTLVMAAVAIYSKITMEYSPIEISSTMFALFASVSNLGLVVLAPLFTGILLDFLENSFIVLALTSIWFFIAILLLTQLPTKEDQINTKPKLTPT